MNVKSKWLAWLRGRPGRIVLPSVVEQAATGKNTGACPAPTTVQPLQPRDAVEMPPATASPVSLEPEAKPMAQPAAAASVGDGARVSDALPPAVAIAGRGDQLFLSGGNQRVEDYLFGIRQPTPQSYKNFEENLAGRKRLAESIGASYVHVVCCDKQSVYREEYPHQEFSPLGERYRSSCPGAEFMYPVELLREARQTVDVYPTVDTHWSRAGELVVVSALLDRLGLADEAQTMRQHYADKAFEAGLTSGDLGSKMNPVRFIQRLDYPERFAKAAMDNRFGGNLGITKLVINPAAPSSRRLLVFGDSFLNSCLGLLSDPFRYLLFVRTPFMHPDAVMMFKPTHILTGNVERYLCHVAPDREAGCVLLAPVLRGHVLDPKNPLYRALDGVLSGNPKGVAQAMESFLTALSPDQPERMRSLAKAWLASGESLSPEIRRMVGGAFSS
jgi:hypothetical protein